MHNTSHRVWSFGNGPATEGSQLGFCDLFVLVLSPCCVHRYINISRELLFLVGGEALPLDVGLFCQMWIRERLYWLVTACAQVEVMSTFSSSAIVQSSKGCVPWGAGSRIGWIIFVWAEKLFKFGWTSKSPKEWRLASQGALSSTPRESKCLPWPAEHKHHHDKKDSHHN